MKISAIAIVLAPIFFAACNGNKNNVDDNGIQAVQDTNKVASAKPVSVYTFPVDKGFGYIIFVNNKAFIKQDCIPVIQGNKPFANKTDAQRTGEFVAQRIRNNQLPTLTQQDLNTLAVTQ